MENSKGGSGTITIIVAVIGAIGVFVTAYFTYQGVQVPIRATQTAEARLFTGTITALALTPAQMPSSGHTPIPSSTDTPVPSTAPTATIQGTIIFDMDSDSGWVTYHTEGTTIKISTTKGYDNKAVQISYDLVPDGYVGISKQVDRNLFVGSGELSFTYWAAGATNMIEFKVIYIPNTEGKSAVFSIDLPRATPVEKWTRITVPYRDLRCWKDTGCDQDGVDAARIWKIEFAISTKEGGSAGIGTVVIDNIIAE
jgi:hypothetical protein